MNINKCDKCEVQKPPGVYTINKNAPWVDGTVRGSGLNLSFDLCADCGQDFVAYIKQYFRVQDSVVK
ncbi:hypothetical protein HYW17_03010 [Candidatus Uhrbacteria bacterium]|nr:hypothetical protein [Candidatus Uhrbacteria bacterium]